MVEDFLCDQMVNVIFICKNIPSSTNLLLHLGDVQSLGHGIHDLVKKSHGFLGTVSFCVSSSIGYPKKIFVSWLFPTSVAISSSLLMTYSGTERRSIVYLTNFRLTSFSARIAHICNRRCLHSKMMSKLCTASWCPFRAIHTLRCCPHRIIS